MRCAIASAFRYESLIYASLASTHRLYPHGIDDAFLIMWSHVPALFVVSVDGDNKQALRKKTVVLVTHQVTMSAPYADKIVIMDGNGTIKEQGTYEASLLCYARFLV